MLYDLGHKPSKSQVFAQKIYQIAVNDRNLAVESISPVDLNNLAAEAIRRFPKKCDARFWQTAIDHIRAFQNVCSKG